MRPSSISVTASSGSLSRYTCAKVNTVLDALLIAVRRRVVFTYVNLFTDEPFGSASQRVCESACVIAGC